MRPKIVLLTLVVALGLVALAAALKSMVMKSGANSQTQTAGTTSKAPAAAPTATGGKAVSSTNAALTDQLRAAEIEKEKDEIRGLIVEGASNPAGTSILVEKVTHHPEPTVRGAALEALVALNDTNAIPGLQSAAQVLENPREKAAILDAIDYLSLPETMPDTPATNDIPAADPSQTPAKAPSQSRKQVAAKSKASRREKQGQRNIQPGQTAPQAVPAPQTQPQAAAPAASEAAPPQ